MNAPYPVRVAAGLIARDGCYLITRRKTAAHLGGCWEFPGGKCEPAESLEDCLRRELREELGIEVADPVLFGVIRHTYSEQTVDLHFFRCRIRNGEPRALGCDELRWVRPEELMHFEFPPADQSLIEALQHEIPD